MSTTFMEVLCKAVRRFYQEDAATLYCEKVRSECPMAGCIYRYLWSEIDKLQQEKECMHLHVDTEYARVTNSSGEDSNKEIYVKAGMCFQCRRNGNCVQRIGALLPPSKTEDKSISCKKEIRPDIIVHRRRFSGKKNNLLVIEVKREGANRGAIKNDQAKLMFLTCPKSERLQYALGALVMLRREYADVGFYSGGKVISGYRVDESGFRKMREEEYDGKPWLNQKKAKQ